MEAPPAAASATSPKSKKRKTALATAASSSTDAPLVTRISDSSTPTSSGQVKVKSSSSPKSAKSKNRLHRASRPDKESETSSSSQQEQYTELSVEDISKQALALCDKVPLVPKDGFLPPKENGQEQQRGTNPKKNGGASTTTIEGSTNDESSSTFPKPTRPCHYDKERLRDWAQDMVGVLEELYLLLSCISPATYVWGTERSGAAEQNLAVLGHELDKSRDQLASRVAPRLNDVLTPVVTLVTDKTVVTTTTQSDSSESKMTVSNGGPAPDGNSKTEIRQNYFKTTVEDPDFVDLSYELLAKQAPMIRQVVLANLHKLVKAMDDYVVECSKDNQTHDMARGFTY